MLSVGLPSVRLRLGLGSRASNLPELFHDALHAHSALAMQRATFCLNQLAAIATFIPDARFAIYCREINKLLALYTQNSSRRPELSPLLYDGALRVAAIAHSPFECSVDEANLNALRQARGATAIETTVVQTRSAAWALPALQELLLNHLRSAHYTLQQSQDKIHGKEVSTQLNSFYNLNHVGAMWFGQAMLEKVTGAQSAAQTCFQILRLELCCSDVNNTTPPHSIVGMRTRFTELSVLKTLCALQRSVCLLVCKGSQSETVETEKCLLAFLKVNACCNLLNPREFNSLRMTSESGQQLALHLRCWTEPEHEGGMLLCLCVLFLEQQIEMEIAALQQARPRESFDLRLRRKIQHYIRSHRRRLRSRFAQSASSVELTTRDEVIEIHKKFTLGLNKNRQSKTFTLVEDVYFHALVRFKAIALYTGEIALYELLWNLREIFALAIERRLLMNKAFFLLMPRLTAYCLRSGITTQGSFGYDTTLISNLNECVRAQRQALLLRVITNDSKITLPSLRQQKPGKRTIASEQLPVFLAQNIRSLTQHPQPILECESAQEFAEASRACRLELSLLACGAKALQVMRVAALSEAMLEVYRALCAFAQLPRSSVITQTLYSAHRCLRLALNQAAARQSVSDVRPTILSLYQCLESLYQAPVQSPRSQQAALNSINLLAADIRGFADIFAGLSSRHQGATLQLAQEQLLSLMISTRQIQEDLSAAQQISIARWWPPLLRAVGQQSNKLGKQACLVIAKDEIQVHRALVERLVSPLERLISLLIEHSIEAPALRMKIGKNECAHLTIHVRLGGGALTLLVEDDGCGVEIGQLAEVVAEIEALGGSLDLKAEYGMGARACLIVPTTSSHWDIAS